LALNLILARKRAIAIIPLKLNGLIRGLKDRRVIEKCERGFKTHLVLGFGFLAFITVNGSRNDFLGNNVIKVDVILLKTLLFIVHVIKERKLGKLFLFFSHLSICCFSHFSYHS
jgi:hypothetical protein